MIVLRYLSAPLFIIIFSLISNPLAYAAGEKEREQKFSIEEIEVSNKFNKHEFLISQKEESTTLIEEKKQKSQGQNNRNNHLSLLGIVATSILFVVILLLLFKEDNKIVVEENHSKLDIDDKDNEIIENEELVFQPDFSKPVIEKKEDLSKEQLGTLKSKKNIVPVNKYEVEVHNSKPKVSSDVVGKLTIKTSSITEIDVVFELIQDLQNNSNYNDSTRQKDLRRKAIWELGQTNDFRAIRPLVKTISKVDSLEKNLILDAITQIANHSLETINNILLTSLEDDSVEVRKNAIQDLTTLYKSMSLITAHLSKMTADSDREVQQTAVWALEQFKQMSIPVASVEYKRRENRL